LEASSARRDEFLLRAVEQYERTLKLDPEDLDAHYGLYQCFQMLGLPAPRVKVEGAGKTDEDALVGLSATLRDGKAAREDRLAAAAQLGLAVSALGREPTTAKAPKRPRFDLLAAQLRPAFHKESDPAVKAALAGVLGNVHRELHAIFKPDELARARATRIYRE